MDIGSCYITGTDTEIGKTFVTCALLREARTAGRNVIGMKPVASGCVDTVDGWRSEDALVHMEADQRNAPYIDRNPYALPLPVAPEIAAREAGIGIELGVITNAYARLRESHDNVLVEGVGGWLAPLTETLEQAEVVRALGLPVVMVVGMRLGCVHQARATQRAIEWDGCTFAGWIANPIDPSMLNLDDNLAVLTRVMGRPPLRVMPGRR